MPAYKDEARGTWYVKFYYTDWTGKSRQKKKRGFPRKKDAQEWEREFLDKFAQSSDMAFSSLYQKYMEYCELVKKNRPGTLSQKRYSFETKILPYFNKQAVNSITPADIVEWQKEIIKLGYEDQDDGYADTYLRSLNSQLSRIFNHAVKFYGLKENPCHKAGFIGSKEAANVDFWTLDEFNLFIPTTYNKPRVYLAINALYWSGLRKGELFALCPPDLIHTAEGYGLDITKSWQIVDGKEVIGPPKTKNSTRLVTIPDTLGRQFEDYLAMLYECPDDERILYGATSAIIKNAIDEGAAKVGIKSIRIHDLRHSHVALLIRLGYNFQEVAERIGDTVEEVIKTYAHLYPKRHRDIADHLETFISGTGVLENEKIVDIFEALSDRQKVEVLKLLQAANQ